MASMYVQKYTRKPKTETKDEFFVSADKFSVVSQFKNKIERMYNVEIHFEKKPVEGGHWMLMNGEPVDRRNAKNYIKAICHPEETKQVKFPASTFKEFSDMMTLESIEKSTNAVIRPLKDVATYEIGGTELGVTLALSQMEEIAGSLHMDPNETLDEEAENDENIFQISPGTNNASKRLCSQLERALSENSDGICSIDDYKYAPPSVKRVLVNCLADNELDDIDEDLLFSEGKIKGKDGGSTVQTDRPAYRRVYSNSGEKDELETDGERGTQAGTNTDTLTKVGSLSDKLHETSLVSNESVGKVTKQQQYLKTFGLSVGYSDDKVKRALNFVTDKTRPSDFLDILNGMPDEEVDKSGSDKAGNVIILTDSDSNEDDDDDAVIILETETIDMETGKGETIKHDTTKQTRKNSVTDTSDYQKASSCQGLPDRYREMFLDENDGNLSVEELKRRNAERQRLLKENLIKQKQEEDGNVGGAKKKGKNKKKKKKQGKQQQQQVSDAASHDSRRRYDSGENKTYSQDEDQTCVLQLWDQHPARRDCSPYQNMGQFEVVQSPKGKYRGNNSQSETLNRQANYQGNFQNYPTQGSQNWSQPLAQRQDFRQNSPSRNRQSTRNQYSQNASPHRPTTSTSYAHGKPTQVVTPSLSGPGYPPVSQLADVNSEELRYIVIDGSNVAMTHGNGKCFSCKGLRICVDYFKQRGHKKITVFVPQWRTKRPCDTNPVMDQNILHELKEEEILVFTPSRRIGGKLVAAYDDRFVMELAEAEDGVIVSNDQYRDLMLEKHSWRKLVEERLLMYSFVKDRFMVPNDPMGRDGPCLEDFLRKTDTGSFNQGFQGFQPMSGHGQLQGHQGHYQGHSQGHQGHYQQNHQGHFQMRSDDFPKFQDHQNDFNRQSNPNQKWKGHNPRSNVANQYQGFDVTDNGPRNKSPSKSSWHGNKGQSVKEGQGLKIRSEEETDRLLYELRVIFPEAHQEDIIKKILANHDKETDLMKLTNYCMSVFFT